MKTVVYTIAKNEEEFCERYMKSCKGADHVCILDTGSTDKTVETLQKLGADVKTAVIDPWRFDIARNENLKDLPQDADVCICLDMDEVLVDGWLDHLRGAYGKDVHRYKYKYTWSWLPDGKPDLIYDADKIHCRHGYRWRQPVHEVLTWIGEGEENTKWCGLEIEHYPKGGRKRDDLPLLELAVIEDPEDDRSSHYYGRELLFAGRNDDAIAELKRHLTLERSQFMAERAASMRHIATAYKRKDDHQNQINWLLRACAEAPEYREPWVDLAQAYFDVKNFPGGYFAAKQALAITRRQNTYLTEAWAWSDGPYDLAGTCAYYIGLHLEAFEFTMKAFHLSPQNERIKANVEYFEAFLKENYGDQAAEIIEYGRVNRDK